MEFAKTMPSEFGEREFVDRVNQVVELKEIQTLAEHEVSRSMILLINWLTT